MARDTRLSFFGSEADLLDLRFGSSSAGPRAGSRANGTPLDLAGGQRTAPGYGFEGSRLPYLLMKAGLFDEAHRAVDHCLALLEIQALQLPDHNRTVLCALLERARRKTT